MSLLLAAAPANPAVPPETPRAEKLCSPAAYYLAIGDYTRAIQSLPTVKSKGGSSAEAANLRGVAQLLAGDTQRALADFDIAIKSDSTFLEARFNRGIALLKLERFDAALEMFRAVAETNDARFTGIASYHAALASDRNGDPAGAQQWLDRALKADNSLDSALLYLGVVREKQRDFGGAGEAYKEYLTRHPDSIVAMLRFGVCAYRAGFMETAKKYLHQVVHLAPASAEAAEAQKFLVMWD